MRLRPFPRPPAGSSHESTLPAAALVLISFGLYWLLPGHVRPVPALLMVVLVAVLITLLVGQPRQSHQAVMMELLVRRGLERECGCV